MFKRIEADRATLWCGKSTDLYPMFGAQGLPEQVDHVISDPPYGRFAHTAQRYSRDKDGDVGLAPVPFGQLTLEDRSAMLRFCGDHVRGWLLAFCETEQVGVYRDAIEEFGLKGRSPAVWIKPDGQPNFRGDGPAMNYEAIFLAWCGGGHSKWNGGGKSGVYTFVKRHTGSHPTEKPLPLMRQLISDFTQPDDLVFDPFMGSGSTGVAALELGRRFIGAEMNDDYFAIACKRIEAASKVISLAVAPKPQAVALFDQPKYRRAAKKEKV